MNEAKEKELILERIQALAGRSAITKEEVDVAFYKGLSDKDHLKTSIRQENGRNTLGMAEVLYYIGAGIVFLGIVILVRENWESISVPFRILVTLGSGIAAYIIGFLFGRDERSASVSPAFYFIFSLVTPVGLAVVFHSAGFLLQMNAVQSIISAIVLVICLVSYFIFQNDVSESGRSRTNIFLLFSILFGSWLFFAFTGFLLADGIYANPVFDGSAFFEYRLLATGLVYCLLGYSFSSSSSVASSSPPGSALRGFLYGAGILMFLGSALALGGWAPAQNPFWELIFPVLVFAVLFISVRIKSRSFLTFGSIFLMAYILKVTSEYFSSNFGWPVSLVFAGLLLIGVGWLSLYLSKKFVS